MSQPKGQNILLGATVVLALGAMAIGGILTATCVDQGWVVCSALGPLRMLGSVGFLEGLRVRRCAPSIASVMVLGGVFCMAIMTYRSIVTLVLALLMGWYGLTRAQGFAKEKATVS